jgi:hypothetical protein
MPQKIQRLLFLSASMSTLFFVWEPVILSIQPVLAATGPETGTVKQNNSHEEYQNSSQVDSKAILRKKEPAKSTASSHRLIMRNTSSLPLAETRKDALLQPSSSTSPVRLPGSVDSQTRVMPSHFAGPNTLIPPAKLGGTVQPVPDAVVKATSSVIQASSSTSKAVAAPLASPMQPLPLTAPLRRLMSEMPELTKLAAPPLSIAPPASPKPAIGMNATSFSLSAQQGDSNSTTQSLTVTNIGGGTLNWNATATAAWLTLSPASGKDAGTIAVTAVAGALTEGTYNALIAVSAAGATPVSIPVTFTVTAPSPTLSVSPTALTVTGIQGGTNPASQTVAVTSSGSWTASSSATWLTLTPSSGTGNGSIAAGVALSSAVVGPNNATITVTSGGVARTIAVTLSVSAASLTASPTSVSYTATQGAANPSAQTIAISSNGTWTASENAAWLSISSTSGTGNGSISATATTGALTEGTYNALIAVSAAGATPVSIPVTFTVTAPSPTLSVSPTALTVTGIQGGTNPASQTVAVTSSGSWTASSSATWLTLTPSSGTGNGSIAAGVALSSAVVGPNNATITVTSGGVARTIAVTLSVSAASLTASPTSVSYTATQGAANPSAQTIAISSNGTWTASENAAWLSLSPTSGSNNGTITASVNTATATQGNNSTTITVMSGGVTSTVNVTLTMSPPSSSSVTLTWNANTESDLSGYRVYRATSSGAYGAPIATIQGNTTTYIATGLQFGTTYFFVVTAYDIAGNESAYSNEVSKSIF